MAAPTLPNVKKTAWHHPYKFSHKLPFKGFLLMLGMGILFAVIAGVVSYFGGAVSRWLQVQLTHLASWVVRQFGESIGLGAGVSFALVILPSVVLAILVPYMMGSVAGYGVTMGAQAGKARTPFLAGLLGFLAGGAAYAAFVYTGILMKAPPQLSSRVLEGTSQADTRQFMVLECLLVLYAAVSAARETFKTPFCEACGRWYSRSTVFTIPASEAGKLVDALANGSLQPLQSVSLGNYRPGIQVSMTACESGHSDYSLKAVLMWDEKKKNSSNSKKKNWFSTTLSASLGYRIETWVKAGSAPAASISLPSVDTGKSTATPPAQPAPSTSQPVSLPAQDRSPVAAAKSVQPAANDPNFETCKRCGRTFHIKNRTGLTCPYCGRTQWGTILVMLLLGACLLGGSILWGLNIHSILWKWVVFIVGGFLGIIFIFAPMEFIRTGLKTKRIPLSEVMDNPDLLVEKPAPQVNAPAREEKITPLEEVAPASQPVVEPQVAVVSPLTVEPAVPSVSPQLAEPVAVTATPADPGIDWSLIASTVNAGDYEQVARILATLDKRSDREYDQDRAAYDRTCRLIKDVGRQLDQKGGEDLMAEVLTRAGALGANRRFIEREWNGIGSWMG